LGTSDIEKRAFWEETVKLASWMPKATLEVPSNVMPIVQFPDVDANTPPIILAQSGGDKALNALGRAD